MFPNPGLSSKFCVPIHPACFCKDWEGGDDVLTDLRDEPQGDIPAITERCNSVVWIPFLDHLNIPQLSRGQGAKFTVWVWVMPVMPVMPRDTSRHTPRRYKVDLEEIFPWQYVARRFGKNCWWKSRWLAEYVDQFLFFRVYTIHLGSGTQNVNPNSSYLELEDIWSVKSSEKRKTRCRLSGEAASHAEGHWVLQWQ